VSNSKGSQSIFLTDHLKTDLRRRSVRGGAVTLFGQGIKFCLQLGSTIVLARILVPQDFGLIAMVSIITRFLAMFKDLGLSMATVQKAEINDGQISTLFWINVTVSFVFMLLTMALAPVIAWFYGEPRLAWVTIALASAYIFGGLTVQHQALLRRRMRFVALVTIDIVSMVAGVVTGIICGLAGLGYWSLVWMQLATPFFMAFGVWIACAWRPGLPVRGAGVRTMLVFGGYQTLANIISFFTRNIDKVLIGRFCGSYAAGLYSRAFTLSLLPAEQVATPILSVAVPALSRLQNEPKRYRDYYLKAVKAVAYITMPLVAVMGALSTQIVWLVLGDQWTRAGLIFRFLAFAAFWFPICQSVIWVYLSLGQTRRMTVWFSMACPTTILAIVIGLPWGPEGVAIGYAIITCLLVYPLFAFCLKHSPIKTRDLFLAIWRPFAVSVLIYLGTFVTQALLRQAGPVTAMLGALSAGIVICLLSTVASVSLRRDISGLAHTVRSALFRENAAGNG